MESAAPGASLSLFFNGYAWWLMLPLAGLLGFSILRLYLKETAPCNHPGAWLRGLRAAVIVLLVLLLSQPVLHRVTAKYEPPVVIVLRDQSDSMTVKDTHEPPERKVRTAVALGLLVAKARDLSAEDAAGAFLSAQNLLDSAMAAPRQALQQLQESGGPKADIQDRLSEARKALVKCGLEARRGVACLKSAPQAPPQLKSAAEKCAESAAALEHGLGEVPAKPADAKQFLQDKGQSLKVLKQELAKLVLGARQAQDQSDRALGESGKPPVKDALDRLAQMDRKALVAAVLEKAAVPIEGQTVGGVRVVTYNIDTDLRSADVAARTDRDKPPGETPRGDTDLATPLLKLAQRHAQDPITAVVLCSDGRHTTGPAPEDAARALAARGIALHTLGVGSLDAPNDICVASLEGTLSVFLDETIHLTAHIKSSGLKGRNCKLVLRQGEKEIQRRELTLPEDGWLTQDFEVTADKSGPNVFRAAIEPLPGETLLTNNSAEAVVDVANERLRVLVVDEFPRWESRYVASLLRRERRMNMTERWLVPSELSGPRRKALPGEKPAGPGAASSALDEFDIVVLGDVAPDRLEDADQKRLARFVADRGGFLIVLAGSKAMPRSYPAGPLAELLPVRQQRSASEAQLLATADAPPRVRVKLDADGSRNEMVRVLRDPVLNEQLWSALPELQWVARPAFAKPGATTLLCTDDLRRDAVAAVHNYGAGRVLYLGTDNTWRWRYKVADRVHAVFWSQAFRWGTSNRLAGGERLKVGLDRRQVRPGENVEVIARPRDKHGAAAEGVTVVAELQMELPLKADERGLENDLGAGIPPRESVVPDAHGGARRQRVQLQPVPDSGGLYRGILQNLDAGIHNVLVKVESPDFEGLTESIQVLAREVSGQEGVELSRDAGRLAAMAAAGSGQYADILEAPQLFKNLAGQGKQRTLESSYELWSSYPALLLVVLLLAAEWLLRKKMGLA